MPLAAGEVYAKIHTATRLWRGSTTIDEPPSPANLAADESYVQVASSLLVATPPVVLVRNAAAEPDEFPWSIQTWVINNPPTSVRAPTDTEAFLGSSAETNPEDDTIVNSANAIATSTGEWNGGPMEAAVTLTNVGTTYDAIAASQRLPFINIINSRINQVRFEVRVNKVGAGTQSWQLWDDTVGAEVAVIDDAGAAGVKYLNVTVAYTPAAPFGLRRWRIRVRSTVAADDPEFIGAHVAYREKQSQPVIDFAAAIRNIHSRRYPVMTTV